ncbi:MAG: hypothetical protein KJ795_08455 [Gammaproteobacteria bacterium]|nr:hypothetical protein [Gammaproteobacteria bacterium]MBU1775864.1 hypothetical protein [Gammaproteobacteria bacterium]MBU1970021.1 hypothetical protein [Gammaproteobacteria bacterium]
MSRKFQRLLPRSLRRQFALAAGGLALLILASGVFSVYALRAATGTTRLLVEERMVHMQDAQDLVQHTLLIERESYQLVSAESVNAIRIRYAEIVARLAGFDRLVDRLASNGDGADGNIALLELHQSSQLFRNTVNIFAQLRENEMHMADGAGRGSPFRADRQGIMFRDELRRQASAMVVSARTQSERFTSEFQAAMQELSQKSAQNQRWMTVLLVVSLLLAWLLAHLFLGRHVLDRLQVVSRNLRLGDEGAAPAAIPVHGDDEIGEMARAVEQFQNDRRQLAQRTAEVEAANKDLESFAYSVSHDLRAPLRAIDGFSHILLDGYADKMDDEGKRLLGVVRSNVQRMAQLIDDILRFFRTGKLGMSFSSIDMERLGREVIEELRVPDSEAQFELGQLPPARGDRAMLRQVLINLISNAIKFSRTKEPPRIKVGGSIKGNEVVYYVRDNGVGFDMQFADKLFGVFQRLHGVDEFEGTGIGLAIVKRIIARHGGRVWAESRLNEGTTIYFSLPLAVQ